MVHSMPAPGRPLKPVPSDSYFGRWLRHEREKRGLTGEALAALIGTRQGMISSYERGERKPKSQTAARLARAMGLHPREALAALQADSLRSEGIEIERVPDADEQEVLAYYSGLEPGGKGLAKDLLEALARHGRETESAASIGGRGRRDTTQPGIDESATDGADGAGAPENGTGRTL